MRKKEKASREIKGKIGEDSQIGQNKWIRLLNLKIRIRKEWSYLLEIEEREGDDSKVLFEEIVSSLSVGYWWMGAGRTLTYTHTKKTDTN